MKALNWDKKIDSIEHIITYWNKRRLSLFAKVKVIKTYVISKISFLALLIEVPEDIIVKIKSICYNFLWGGKRDKIKRTTINANMKDGGLNMIDIDAYLLSLKASWIPKILNIKGNWKKVFEHYVNSLGIQNFSYIFKMNFTDIKSVKAITKLPKFYIDVLIAYNKCKTVHRLSLIDEYQLLTQPIWGNKLFQINGECLYFSSWIKSNILYIKDLINDDGTIKTDYELCDSVVDKREIIRELFLLKKCVINKIKGKNVTNAQYTKIRNETSILNQNNYYKVDEKRSSFFYRCLKQQNASRGNMETIWSRNFNFDNSKFVWNNIYQQKIISMQIAKVAEFNYKVIHNILPCGKVLSKWLNNCTEKCLSCGELETTEHMLFMCKYIRDIWNAISEVIKLDIKWKNIVCGLISSEQNKNVKFINLVISVVAYSMFKFSNKKRWNEKINCENIKQMVVRDLLFMKLMLKNKGDQTFEDNRISMIIEKLID